MDKTTLTRDDWLDQLRFQYPLRKYQSDIIALCDRKLKDGEKELHIVAPPGSGKTIIGLEIITRFRCPSLVVCPNTTIQSQWADKLGLFLEPEFAELARPAIIGTHDDRPLKPITVLTYQVLTVPGKEQEFLENHALKEWTDEMAESRSLSRGEAEVRILDLKANNKSAYKKEISRHVTRLRRKLTDVMTLEEILHENALELVQVLKRQGCGLVIFDECHHLTDYWASVMIHLVRRLQDVTVVGLTGTPPEAKTGKQKARYLTLVGEIDFQVPTPALVKEGGLAPFQDLVYFTEPTAEERAFLKEKHQDLHEIIENKKFREFVESQKQFVERKPELAMALARYFYAGKLPLPGDLVVSEAVRQSPQLDDWLELLEDFALNQLKTSADKEDHELLKTIGSALKKIGFSLSERGIRSTASPVDRVLAYSRNKSRAVATILDTEYATLDDRLRALVITDFERMSATVLKSVSTVLDADAGGAIGVARELIAHPVSASINPCLVTGTLVLIDSRITTTFRETARRYLEEAGEKTELELTPFEADPALTSVSLPGGDWSTRLYVGLITHAFETGVTKCLVGTRGIFGEGWDSQQLNTVIDLTTTTSPVSVKQLRGRGIRLDTSNISDPLADRKVTNNWDVVAIAPELEKGLNDYSRFVRKHQGYFGIADDGQIECGVGHVHPSFSDLTPTEVFASLQSFNEEMLKRALVRDQIYELWKVGKPYANRQLGCIEIAALPAPGAQPAHVIAGSTYPEHARQLRQQIDRALGVYIAGGIVASITLAGVLMNPFLCMVSAMVIITMSTILGLRHRARVREELEEFVVVKASSDRAGCLSSIARALLDSLIDRNFLPGDIEPGDIVISQRSHDNYRVFLDGASEEHTKIFVKAFEEIMAPVTNQPYLIPRYSFDLDGLDRRARKSFFNLYLTGRAEPDIAAYHAVPRLLARSEKGRESFEFAWNQHVSPGFVAATQEDPLILQKYFGLGPSLAERLLWD